MHATHPETPARRLARRAPLTPMAAILLAISLGLCSGYLDVLILIVKRYFWNSEGHFRNARDFPWTVPLGHAVLMLALGLVVAGVNRFRPVPLSLRAGAWLFATFAIWSALLRTPMDGKYSLVLAAGLGRVIGDAVAAHPLRPRQTRAILATLVGVLAVAAVLSSGWQALREYRTMVGLPPSAPGARNVVVIVWDTVRAYSLSHYDYPRQNHSQPDAMGTAGRHVQTRAVARSMDLPFAFLLFHRRMALQSQFSVEVHS